MKNAIFKGISLLFTISFFISISLAAPAEPTSVSAIDVSGDNGGNISITWTKSTDDGAGGNNVSYYEILRSTVSSSGPFSLIFTRPNGSVSYTDNTTSDGTPYWYKVNASDGTNSSSSSVVGPVQSKENIPPIISSVTNGTVNDSTAVITWTTDEASTSRVDYDTNPSVPYDFTEEETAYVTSHSITLSGLNANTTYYYVVKSTDSAGNPNTSAEFNFTTSVDITKPNVTSTNPSNGASNAPLNTNITATFSEDMNVSTINNFSFTLTGATAISGTVSYNVGTKTATFNPYANLNYSTTYTATVTTAVTDLIGNAMNSNKVWTFTTLGNQAPTASLDSVSPPDGVTPVTFNFSVRFTDAENESLSNVKVYIEGVDYAMNQVDAGDLTTSDGKDYKLTITNSVVGTHDYYFKATDSYGNTGQSSTKNFEVFSATYYSGDRIWSDGMSRTYVWNPQSFSGFYYDLDTNVGSETLTIEDIDRSLNKGTIIYKTSPIPIKFEYGNWGTYDVIGFMADRYFAGYHANSFASSSDNLLDKRKLSKVLTDNDKSYNVRTGSSLKLEEGYEFRISEMSTSGSAVMVGLFKDGGKVKEDIVSEGDTFSYEKDLGSAKNIPIIAIYIDTVFAGMETSTVIVEGIFQISEKYITVDTGNEFGEMEVTSVSSTGITMKNEGSVSLSEGDDFNLMGKINIIVADDSNTLRFAPYVDISEPGTYELRGTVTEETSFDWTPFNFEALLYDIDTGEGDEILHVERSSPTSRTVAVNKLTYTVSPIKKSFEHSSDGWKNFQSIGFMGNTYFAGYLKESSFLTTDRSLIEEGKLSKILMDEDKRYTLHIGNSLPLQEGYSVRIDEISRSGEALMFTILKNGEEIDTDISSGDDTYVYEVKVGDTDIPIFIFHIDQVFRGMETNSVFIDGVFQISEKFTTIEKGDSYGIMEVTSTTSSSIVMKNKDDSISLGEGDTISIMGDIKIKVADDSTVRFYPFKEIVVEEPLYLELDIPNNVYQNEELTIKVTSDGDNIKGATIKFGDTSIGTTDSSGELSYTPTEPGTFTITASKEGYESDDDKIEVLYQPKVLLVSTPLVSDKGESIVISVTSEGVGVKDASVKFGSNNLGTTPASGNITYTPDEVGTFTISASRSGYQDATKDIDITDPGAKLVFSNLTIIPRIVEPGENVNITVEAANFGTLREAQTMYLKVNGDVVISQDLVLGPGEIVTIHFNMNRSKAGTYLVEVDGRSNTFRVKGLQLGSTSLFVGGIIALLSTAAIVYSISQGTLTVDILSAKVQAFEKMLRQLVEK
ncbi:MAG: Ig-like domain-containing protein [ANME-2 cluster archaeon]|nr:Ig-like domain-containing protein [ANME-2 cluster archaeon]